MNDVEFVNKTAELIIPDSILVLDADSNLVNEELNEKPLVEVQDQINENNSQENDSDTDSSIIVLHNNKNRIIDETKKRRFESMMAESEDEDKIVEIKDSNQNLIYIRE